MSVAMRKNRFDVKARLDAVRFDLRRGRNPETEEEARTAAEVLSLGDSLVQHYAVARPRISTRNGVAWLTARSWSDASKLAGIESLKAAKDSLSASWLGAMVDDLERLQAYLFEAFDGVVTAPPARHSAFRNVEHFASLAANQLAERIGTQYAQCFEPTDANRAGHHPRREKEPPKVMYAPPRVLLIDDVATSGQTVELCAKALRERGSKVSVMVWIYGTVKI